MKSKKIVAVVTVLALLMSLISVSYADPTTDFHEGPLPGQSEGDATGPAIEEYMVYKEQRNVAPGSLSGDVDLSTVGKGLFYDGTDFYFYIDTGVMATNYMYTIEGDKFFFGEDGKMVKEQLISYNDELYYFDVNGAMYKNRWYSAEELDESDNTLVYTDYYFGPTGRAYRANSGGTGLVIKTIEGEKYGFNSDGEKLEGYYDQNGVKIDPDSDPAYEDCVYYFDPDENGVATKGWHYYEGAKRGDEYQDTEEIVLYFDEKTCRKVAAKATYATEGRCVSRIIEGQRYMFDHYGVRKNSWYNSEPFRASHSNAKYFSEEYDGYLQKGWFQAVPGAYSSHGDDLILEVNRKKHNDDDDCWFYAGKNGNIYRKTIRKIGSHVYAFDDDGVMQQDAFVKVKNGAFVKAYETDYLTRANILLDPNEYGGNADPDINTNPTADPINLDPKKGLLNAGDGEVWSFFMGDYAGEERVGAQAKENTQIKIELKDSDIFFMQNTAGGYTRADRAHELADVYVTAVVQRSGKLMQNGVVLKPNPDDNNYGVIRAEVSKIEFGSGSTMLNYKNERINVDGWYYSFKVVNSDAKVLKATYKSYKDKTDGYLYLGIQNEFIGYYPYQGKYFETAPSGMIDEDGNDVVNPSSPCWAYKKDGEKRWIYGLPPQESRLDPSTLFLNFNADSACGIGDFGPYNDGIASLIYTSP